MLTDLNTRLEEAITAAFPLSINLLKKMEEIGIEIGRRAKLANMLLKIGLQKRDKLIINVLNKALEEQRKDGGWGSIEESLICLRFISNFQEENLIKDRIKKAVHWLFLNQNKNGGWGRCVRDRSRIPMTFRIVEIFYDLGIKRNSAIERAYAWMENEWNKDMRFSGLSYKASGILIANKCFMELSKRTVENTLRWLLQDQNKDGGWGPNQYSPVGSTPNQTSLVLRALLKYNNPETKKAIEKGMTWIVTHQLKGGQWKEHPPEDGVVGCVDAITLFLKTNP